MVYSYAAKVRIAVYVKSNSQRGTWREGRDRADDMYVEGLYRVHSRELVTADSVGPEDRLVMTRHESLKQLYIERGLMGPTEQIFTGSVDRSMAEGKHLLGYLPSEHLALGEVVHRGRNIDAGIRFEGSWI